MKRYTSTLAICPFYKHESKQMIDCVGAMDGTVLHLAFDNASNSFKYKSQKCRAEYTECPIYKMLTQERGDKYNTD